MENLRQFIVSSLNAGEAISLVPHKAGFLSTNYVVETGKGKFFLKCYRFSEREKIVEIHRIKNFFASKGVPVIMPLKTSSGETFFTLDGRHYALFPFVEGIHFKRDEIPPHVIRNLAAFLGRMHAAGAEVDFNVKTSFKDKGVQTFLTVARQIEQIIHEKPEKNEFDALAESCLKLKIELAEGDGRNGESFICEPFILLHGDFHELNMFFDASGDIKYIFDFEQSIMGPRSLELWRSGDLMFTNGFFTSERIDSLVAYFKAYNQVNPIKREELEAGFEIYYRRNMHSLWVEQEHYLKGSTRVDLFHKQRYESLKFMSQHKDEFKKRVLDQVYK